MKALISVILAFTMVLILPTPSLAGVIVSLNNVGSTTLHEIEVAPGDTFSVDVNVDTSAEMWGVDLKVQAGTSNVFDIVQRTDQAPWLPIGSGGIGGLDPQSTVMSWALPIPDRFGPGISRLATLQLQADPAAGLGNYGLGVLAGYRSVPWELEPSGAIAGPGFTVRIVPEPTSVVFLPSLLLGLWFGCGRTLPA